MNTSILTVVIVTTCTFAFSSCQKMGFGPTSNDDSGLFSVDDGIELPCMNKDMASHLYADTEVAPNETSLLHLHLQSCDSMNLKEVQWSFPEGSLIKYTGKDDDILISFAEPGEKTVSVAIVYNDTVLDDEGLHIGGPAPKIVTAKINVVLKDEVCTTEDKYSHLVSEDHAGVGKIFTVGLHLYYCDAKNLKEVRWSASGGKLTVSDDKKNEVNILFNEAGEYEITAVIIYKDTVLDREGNYLSGTVPKVVSKTVKAKHEDK